MPDLFDQKNLAPMLLKDSAPFSHKDYIYELKLDGVRCIAYLDKNATVLCNKRNKDVSEIYPELKQIHKCAQKKCILDGELICLIEGEPNFYAVQKRALMNNQFKIQLSAKQHPVSFVAYDMLYYQDKDITKLPLLERKKKMKENIRESNGLTLSRYIEEKGEELFALTAEKKLEGIIAKKKNGKYYIGKRTSEWLKIKNMIEEDLIIIGFKYNENNGIKDLIMGFWDEDGILHSRGSVGIGLSSNDEQLILKFVEENGLRQPIYDHADEQWLKPKLVGTVKYMQQTPSGHMRQPVFKGIRDDKLASECKER